MANETMPVSRRQPSPELSYSRLLHQAHQSRWTTFEDYKSHVLAAEQQRAAHQHPGKITSHNPHDGKQANHPLMQGKKGGQYYMGSGGHKVYVGR